MKTPEALEIKRLKYLEKQAKYTRKIAECQYDLSQLKVKFETVQPTAPAQAL